MKPLILMGTYEVLEASIIRNKYVFRVEDDKCTSG